MSSYPSGSKAADRIQSLEQSRRRQQDDVTRRRENIVAASATVLNAASTGHFAAERSETVEDLLKSDTVGLVTHRDFKRRREYLQRCAAGEREKRDAQRREERAQGSRARLKKANRATLSFASASDDDDDSDEGDDDDDSEGDSDDGAKRKSGTRVGGADSGEDGDKTAVQAGSNPKHQAGEEAVQQDEIVKAEGTETAAKEEPDEPADESQREEGQDDEAGSHKRRRLGMNPDVATNFLPDREREIAERSERERLKQEWVNRQETIKREEVRITYSYWDGAGHRRAITCRKGTTVGRFLGIVQTQFRELRNTCADALMFIKEDLIIPHHYSFYDFLVTKARGKSGPLFNFDVVEEVRMVADASKEKEDAHAAKVVERRWYERNRHIFPASRWEVYDPTKTYSRYTIHGD